MSDTASDDSPQKDIVQVGANPKARAVLDELQELGHIRACLTATVWGSQ